MTRSGFLYAHSGKLLPLDPGDFQLGGYDGDRQEVLPGFQPRLVRRLLRQVTEFEPDIIQVNGARSVKYGALLSVLSPHRPWRLVYRNIDSPRFWVQEGAKRWAYRNLVMRQMDGVVGVSQATLEEAVGAYRMHVPAAVIRNGIDLARLVPTVSGTALRDSLGTPRSARVALFAGNLGHQKRPDRFLRVMLRATSRHQHLHGWILGDGPLRDVVQNSYDALALGDRIRFLGAREDVANVMNAADILVLTSDTEGIPAVVLEAAAVGVPTLSTAVGGISECVKHDVTGLLCMPGDEDALCEYLVSLATDHRRRRELGAAATQMVKETFSMEVIGPQYLKFYRALT